MRRAKGRHMGRWFDILHGRCVADDWALRAAVVSCMQCLVVAHSGCVVVCPSLRGSAVARWYHGC